MRETTSILARVSLPGPTPPITNISWDPSARGRTTLELQDRGVWRDREGLQEARGEEEEEEEVDCHTWQRSVDTRAPLSEEKHYM